MADSQTIRRRSADDPKTLEDVEQMADSQTIRRRSADDPQTISRRSEDDPKTGAPSIYNDIERPLSLPNPSDASD